MAQHPAFESDKLPRFRVYFRRGSDELVARASDGKVYIFLRGTNAWRRRRPFSGEVAGWERLPVGTAYMAVGMVRGDRERNDCDGGERVWIAADGD